MQPVFAKIVVLGILTTLCGCASVLSDSVYPVAINSSPSAAEVTVTNRNGDEVFRGQTPTQVELKAGAGFWKGENYTVAYSKPGYEPCEAKIERNIDNWYFGNILLGGIPGGLIIDPATGAMWKLEDVNTALTPTTASKSHNQNSTGRLQPVEKLTKK